MPACIDCKQEMVPSERYGEGAFRCPRCDGADPGFWDSIFRNEHGVLVQLTVCSHWVNKNGKPSRTYTPQVCWGCPNHETADVGEYGEIFGPPYCKKNVWPPTKTNKCKVKDKVKQMKQTKKMIPCPFPGCPFETTRKIAMAGHIRLMHHQKGEWLNAWGRIVERPELQTPDPQQEEPERDPEKFVEHFLYRLRSPLPPQAHYCLSPNAASVCVLIDRIKQKNADLKRKTRLLQKKARESYQQALDDIRWGRCKNKCFEYHSRPRSREDRMDEIRALDKEVKGGGNIPQD